MNTLKTDMDKAVKNFSSSIVGIRQGNTSAGLIDSVKIPCFGQLTFIKHCSITGKIGDSVFIDPFDQNLTANIAHELKKQGFPAYQFSKTRVLVSIPPISGDEKKGVIAHIAKLAEEAKIAVRNIRKHHRQNYSKDELKEMDKYIQEETDNHIREIDQIAATKIKGL